MNERLSYEALEMSIQELERQAAIQKCIEKELREREQRFRRFFEDDLTGDFITGPDGTILECNPAFVRIFGYEDKSELLNQNIIALYPDPAERAFVLGELHSKGKLEHYQTIRRRKDGGLITIEENIVATLDQEGNLVEVKGYIYDITDRKRAQEALRRSEGRLRALMEASSDVLYRMSPDWKEMLHLGSRGFLANMEKPSRTWLQEYIPLEDQAHVTAVIDEAIRTKSVFQLEHRVRQADGTLGWTFSRAVPLLDTDGEIVEWFGAASDVTERKRTEQAIEEAQRSLERERNLLQAMIDSAKNSHLVYLDRNFNFVRVNEAYAKTCGYRPEEMVGKNHFALYPHEENESIFAGVRDSGIPAEFHDKPFVFPDQPKRGITYWDWTLIPVKDPSGHIEGFVFSLFETTERKRAEEALKESESSLARAQVIAHLANWELDVRTNRVRGSDELYRIFNLGANFTLPDYVEKFHPDDRARVIESINAAIHEGKPYDIEYRVVPSPGEIRHVHAVGEIIRDNAGAPIKFFGTAQDITERKRMEEAIRRSRDKLEWRVRERTAELERRNRELQEFAFIASHDLNEPLRKIQTFGSLLAAKSAEQSGEEQKDYISRITGTANRMQKLLTALLDYSLVESKGEPLRPTPLNDVVRDAISDLEVGIRNAGAQVRVGPLPIVNGDPQQLRQLFQNLIGNAVKYRRPDILAVVHLYGEEKDGHCRIFVEDNGIGFDEKYLEKIFQPFQRLHGKHEYSGTGIGLAISRKVVERHGGTITAKSAPGKGSTFIVTLPLNGREQ